MVELGGETYDIDEVLETTLIVESVRGAYRALLSSEDEEELLGQVTMMVAEDFAEVNKTIVVEEA